MQRNGRRLVATAAMMLAATVALLPAAPAAFAAAPPTSPKGLLPPDAGLSAASAVGAYYPAPARRLLGTATSGYAAVPGVVARVVVAGVPGVPPSGLSAAVVNLTATAGPGAVAITAFPGAGPLTGAPLGGPDGPMVSGSVPSVPSVPIVPSAASAATSLNAPNLLSRPAVPGLSVTAPAGGSRTTLVTVPLDPAGGFDLATAGGAARVTIDLVGVYAADDTVVARLGAPGGYQPLDPVRLLGRSDTAAAGPTSTGTSATGLPSSAPTIDPSLLVPVPAGTTIRLGVDLGSSTPHVTALAVRASVLTATVAGTVDVTGGARPTAVPPTGDADSDADLPTPSTTPSPLTRPYATPTLTLAPGSAASNLAFVPAVLGSDGLLALEIRNASAGPADIRVDLIGFYDDGQLGPNLRFRSLVPTRVVDTSTGVGMHALGVGGQGTLSPPAAVAGDNTFGLVGTLTVRTTGLGADLALWPGSGARPVNGSLPVTAGSVVAGPVQSELGTDGRLELASSSGPADLTLDVVGSFESYPAVTDPTMRGWVHAVPSWQVRAVRY